MTAVDDLLHRLMTVQRRNASLAGQDLADAARSVARLASEHHAAVVATDSTGDRLLGAALAAYPNDVVAADVTARLTGQTILVLSGAVAGTVGLLQTAARLQSLGATALHAGVLDAPPTEAIAGYVTVQPLIGTTPSAARSRRTSQRRKATAA